jgi:hypothetical protein
VRVAKLASPEDEARFTVTKLDEALAYLEAKLEGLPNGRVPIAFDKARIPVDGTPRGVPLVEATAAQIRAATRALDPKHASKTSPVAAELARALRTTPEAKGSRPTTPTASSPCGRSPRAPSSR